MFSKNNLAQLLQKIIFILIKNAFSLSFQRLLAFPGQQFQLFQERQKNLRNIIVCYSI